MSLTATAEEKNGTSTGSTDDILKSTGNDELKFGLLISLLKVDQVPNKDVVDTVLHLVCIPIYCQWAWHFTCNFGMLQSETDVGFICHVYCMSHLNRLILRKCTNTTIFIWILKNASRGTFEKSPKACL